MKTGTSLQVGQCIAISLQYPELDPLLLDNAECCGNAGSNEFGVTSKPGTRAPKLHTVDYEIDYEGIPWIIRMRVLR